jgi:hypothetical protein
MFQRLNVRPAILVFSWAGLVLLATVSGCANLAAVREFAKTSAATADYKQVVSDYTNSPVRQRRYQPERFSGELDGVVQRRAAQGPLLEAAQQVLVKYMTVLGDVAADKLPDVDSEVDGLSKALETAKFVGDGDKQIDKATASAAASIAKVVASAILDGYRQGEVVKIIKQTNEPLQNVVAGLHEVLDKDMRESLANEEAAVRKPFGAWVAAASSGNDPDGAPPVARILNDERLDQLRVKQANLDAYIKVLDKIAQGHADLFRNVDTLDGKELIARLKGYSAELQTLYKGIKDLSK